MDGVLVLSVVVSGVEEMRASRSLSVWVVSASRRASSAATRDWMCISRSLARVLSVSGLAWRASTRSWEKRTGVSLGLISGGLCSSQEDDCRSLPSEDMLGTRRG